MRRSIFPLLLLPPLLLQSCLTGLGRCNYETRVVRLAGALHGTVQGHPDSATVSLSYFAQRPGRRDLSISIATFFAGAIALAEIRNGSRPGDPVLITFTGSPGVPGEWSAYHELDERSLSPDGYALLGRTGQLKVAVTFLTGTGGLLAGTLQLVEDSGWGRAYCD
jgi:hypothetical protein